MPHVNKSYFIAIDSSKIEPWGCRHMDSSFSIPGNIYEYKARSSECQSYVKVYISVTRQRKFL